MADSGRPLRSGARQSRPGVRRVRRPSHKEMAAALRTVLRTCGEQLGDKVENRINPYVTRSERPPTVGEICPVGIVPERVIDHVCHGLTRQIVHRFSSCASWDEAMGIFAAYSPGLACDLAARSTGDEGLVILTAHREWIPITAVSRTNYIGRFEACGSGLTNIAKMFGYLPTPSVSGDLCLKVGGAEYQCDEMGHVKDGFLSSFADCLSQIGGMYVIGHYLSDDERDLLAYLNTLFEWRSVNGQLECGVIRELEGSSLHPASEQVFRRARKAMRSWHPDSRHMFDFDLMSLAFIRECCIGLGDVVDIPIPSKADELVNRTVDAILSELDWTKDVEDATTSDIRREIRSAWAPHFSLLNLATLQMGARKAKTFVMDVELSGANCIRHITHQWEREKALVEPAALEMLARSRDACVDPPNAFEFTGHGKPPVSSVVGTMSCIGRGVAAAYGFVGGTYSPGDATRSGRWGRDAVSWYRETLHRGGRGSGRLPKTAKAAIWLWSDEDAQGIGWVYDCHGCSKCIGYAGTRLMLLHDHVEVPISSSARKGLGASDGMWCGQRWCGQPSQGERSPSGFFPARLSADPDGGTVAGGRDVPIPGEMIIGEDDMDLLKIACRSGCLEAEHANVVDFLYDWSAAVGTPVALSKLIIGALDAGVIDDVDVIKRFEHVVHRLRSGYRTKGALYGALVEGRGPDVNSTD